MSSSTYINYQLIQENILPVEIHLLYPSLSSHGKYSNGEESHLLAQWVYEREGIQSLLHLLGLVMSVVYPIIYMKQFLFFYCDPLLSISIKVLARHYTQYCLLTGYLLPLIGGFSLHHGIYLRLVCLFFILIPSITSQYEVWLLKEKETYMVIIYRFNSNLSFAISMSVSETVVMSSC